MGHGSSGVPGVGSDTSSDRSGDKEMSRTFKLYRTEDISGVSGTGLICEGVLFSDGHAAIHWLGKYALTTPHPDGLSSVMAIHGHNGKTRLVWDDGPEDGEGFNEGDIHYLHELLASKETAVWHLGARRLLRKIRVSMSQAMNDIAQTIL